jgi:hypothetical protein
MQNDNAMIERLMAKVSEQAHELAALSSQLHESKQIIDNLENHKTRNSSGNVSSQEANYLTTSSFSKDAQKKRIEKEHKDQIHILERQLSITQHRLEEVTKQKNSFIIDNEKLSREAKFHEKCANDLQQDVQRLRVQLETLNRRYGLDLPSSSSSSSSLTNSSNKKSLNFFDEMKLLKKQIKEMKQEKISFENNFSEIKLKNKILEDALEFRVDEIGLSGHADLLTKISYLKGEISALKKEILNKSSLVENLEQEKCLIQSDQEQLQQTVSQLQEHLLQTKQDLNRSKQLFNLPSSSSGTPSHGGTGSGSGSGSDPSASTCVVNALDQIKSLEQERDLLIEFIQNDLQKSSILQTEVMELKVRERALTEEKDKLERQLGALTERHEDRQNKYESLSKDFLTVENDLKKIEREKREYQLLSQKREEEIQELYDNNSQLATQVPYHHLTSTV